MRTGFLYSFAQNAGIRLFQFVVQIVLARILTPDDYGLSAIVIAFVGIASTFVDSGFGSALIQKKDVKSVDFSSVFYVSLGVSVILYAILFFGAHLIAFFFEDERLVGLIRISGLLLLISPLGSIQNAIVHRDLRFNVSFWCNTLGMLFSTILSLYLALNGYGVWAIVIQYVSAKMVTILLYFIVVRWLPKFEFSKSRVKSLFSFGWKLAASSIVSNVSNDVYTTLIGKAYSRADLGLYTNGIKIPFNVSNVFASAIKSVLFASFSKLQDNIEALKQYVKLSNQLGSFIMFPAMLGFAAMADPIIRLVLTEKWADCIPYMQIFCIGYSLVHLHEANEGAINATGHSGTILKLEIAKKSTELLFLVSLFSFDILYVVIGRMVSSFIALWINMKPNERYLNYRFKDQVLDVLPTFGIAVLTAAVMLAEHNYIETSNWLMIIIQTSTGVVLYLALSYLFNKELLSFFLSIVKKTFVR